MSNSRNGQRRFLVGTMKAVVLLMCFALIFALVLTVGVMGGGFGLPVAEAAYSPAVSNIAVNGRTYSSDAEVIAAIQAALHAQNAGSVTVTIDLASTDLQSYSNMSATSGSASNYDWSGRPWDANDGFGAQADTKTADVFSWLNFRIPSAITSFISNSSYSVSARHQAEIWCRRSALTGDIMWGYSFESGTGERKTFSWTGRGGATYEEGDGKGDDKLVLNADKTISNLSSGTTYLYVLMNGNHQGNYGWAVGGGVRATNNVFTFTISVNNITDTAAPQATVNGDNSTLQSTLATDNGTYLNPDSELYEIIKNNAPKDNATIATGNVINMTDAAVGKDSITVGVMKYSKMLTLDVKDRIDSSTFANRANANPYSGVAGGRVSGASIGVSYGNYVEGYFSYNGGTNNGWYSWKADPSRDSGTLTLYFKDNTGDSGVSVTLKDSGGKEETYTVKVAGIYDKASDMSGLGATPPNQIGKDFTGLDWLFNNLLNPSFTGAGTGNASQVWYYTLQRFDTANAALGAAAASIGTSTKTLYPFGYGTNGNIRGTGSDSGFSFETGLFNGQPTASGATGYDGAGYYRITFFNMNYAGYMQGTGQAFYFKVDATAPDVTAEVSYDTQGGKVFAEGDEDRNGIIMPSEEAWVSPYLDVALTFAPNFSGNRVRVSGSDGAENYVVIRDGKIDSVTTRNGDDAAGWTDSSGRWTSTGGGAFEKVEVWIVSSEGNVTLRARYTGVEGGDPERTSVFTVYSNADLPGNSTQCVFGTPEGWTNGEIRLWIDRIAPLRPDISESGSTDETDHILLNTTDTVPQGEERKWYTDSAALTGTFTATQNEYVYTYVSDVTYYPTVEKFQEGLASIREIYEGRTFAEEGSGFEAYASSNVHNISFTAGSEVGYHVMYVFSTDRAGNVSELGVYGALVDPTDYTVRVTIADGYLPEFNDTQPFELQYEDQETFKRGEEINFKPVLLDAHAGAYVPYKLYKMSDDGSSVITNTPVYTHGEGDIDATLKQEYVLAGYDYARVEDGTLVLAVDRSTIGALPIKDGAATLVFSYRRVVNATFSGGATYNGAELKAGVNASFTDNTVMTDVSPEKIPYQVVYPEGYQGNVTNAGSYTLSLTRKPSEFYVLASETPSFTFTVSKAPLKVTFEVTGTGYTYGDLVTDSGNDKYFGNKIAYTLDQAGLLGADKRITDITALSGGSLSFAAITGQNGYLEAGSYTPTPNAVTTNYTISVEWKTGANSIVIGARQLDIAVESPASAVTYGNPLPSEYTFTIPASYFGWDTLGMFGGADKIQKIQELFEEGITVTEGEGYYTVTLPASFVTTKATLNDFNLVNVGDYKITGLGDIIASGNFSQAFDEKQSGVVKVEPVTVTVRPSGNIQPYIVEDKAEIAEIKIPISGADVNKFGITGHLVLDPAGHEGHETGAENYYVLEDASTLASSHNADGVTNVIIEVSRGNVAISVTIRIATGVFVITFNENVTFTTPYGVWWDRNLLTFDGHSYTYEYYVVRDGVRDEAPTDWEYMPSLSVLMDTFRAAKDDVFKNIVGTYPIILRCNGFDGTNEYVASDYSFEYYASDGSEVPDALTVTQAEVEISAATLNETEKVYGDTDPTFAFTYTFGNAPTEDYISRYQAALGHVPAVTGAVRLGMDGAAAGRYDDAGEYLFSWKNARFADTNLKLVVAEGFESPEFTITQRPINLDTSVLVTAGDKPYDGSSTAASATIAFLSGNHNPVVNNDDVKIVFKKADYWYKNNTVSAFIPSAESYLYAIRLLNVEISGEDKGNYTLRGGETLDGVLCIVTDEKYKITPVTIAIEAGGFQIPEKVYDGTDKIMEVTITGALNGIAGGWTLVEGHYASKDAGEGAVTFVLQNKGYVPAGGNAEDYFSTARGMTVEVADDGTVTLTVSVDAVVNGTITKRPVTLDDILFTFKEADRKKVYDGTGAFEVKFKFADSLALAVEGFDADAVGLTFVASVDGKDVTEAGYDLKVSEIAINENGNYTLGTGLSTSEPDALNAKLNEGGKFFITKKSLVFDLTFEEAVYSGAKGPTPTRVPLFGGLVGEETLVVQNDEGSRPSYTYANKDNDWAAFPYVQDHSEGGKYYHDVTATFRLIAGGGFDYVNYDLGDISVSEDDNVTLRMEKAAVLDPKPVYINISLIKVVDKVYDNTTTAQLTFNDNNIAGNSFVGTDADAIEWTYSAAFDTVNVGSGKTVTISNLGIKAKANVQNAEDIARSYKMATKVSSGSLEGNITPATLTVEFVLPDKTYDGNRYAGVGAAYVDYTLAGFIPGDATESNYSVDIAAAGYDSADVAAPGEAQTGRVFGVELVNDLGAAVNYKLDLRESDVFYLYSGTPGLAAQDKIVASMVYDRRTYYLTEEKLSGDALEGLILDSEEGEKFNYLPAYGAMSPADVSFTAIIDDPAAFTKQFDDTATFNNTSKPVYGSPQDVQDVEAGGEMIYDYHIRLSVDYIGITLTGDNFDIAFSDPNVGDSKDIIFTVVLEEGNNNYRFNAGTGYTVRGAGKITPIQLNASLSTEGNSVTYGEQIGFDVSYNINGKEVLLDGEGNAYISTADWRTAFGIGNDYVEDYDYTSRKYMLVNGVFHQSNVGNYVRVNGKFGNVYLSASDGSSITDEQGIAVGDAGTYTGVTIGAAEGEFPNFTISTVGNHVVTVEKKALNVVVSGNAQDGSFEAVYYLGDLPVPSFVIDEAELASFDSVDAILGELASAYSYKLNGTGEDVTSADEISSLLGEGNAYVLVIDDITNYDVTIVDEAGVTVAPVLTIELPVLDETRYEPVADTSRPYELDENSNGEAVVIEELLGGLDDMDSYTVEWRSADGVILTEAPVNAGVYEYTVIVRRLISADDPLKHEYDGEYVISGVFTIERRNVVVTVTGQTSFDYDGNEHMIEGTTDLKAVDAITGQVVEGFLPTVQVAYSSNGVVTPNMVNAGTYSLVLTIGEEYAPNYTLDTSRLSSLRVYPKPVSVTVDPASKTHDVTDGAKVCEIEYSVEDSGIKGVTVTYRDSSGKTVSSISSPGVYSYTISSNDPNYVVRSGASGTITVTIDKVYFKGAGSSSDVTVDFGEPVTNKYSLSDTAIQSGTSYWRTIDKHVQKLATDDEGFVTEGIIRVELKNANGKVSSIGKEVTVTAQIPDGVTVDDDLMVFYVTPQGTLAQIMEYAVENGTITYKTAYISDIVFVHGGVFGGAIGGGSTVDTAIGQVDLWWLIPIALALFVVILALAILIGVLVKLHRAPDPVPVEVEPIDSIMPLPPAPVLAPAAPVPAPIPAADVEPVSYDAPAAVSKHKQPPVIGIR